MKVSQTATQIIEADILWGSDGYMRVSNGHPEAAEELFNSIVGTIKRMHAVLDGPFTVELSVGNHGVTVAGERKT